LLAIPLGGWNPVVTAINLDKWKSLTEAQRNLITQTIKKDFEDPAWASAQSALKDDIACLTGNGACPAGDARNMTLVEVSDADFNRARTVLIEQVLPDWSARAGGNWGQRWNDSVGKVVGVSIK
jgi:TRAP-type C4-dicarboxylate transport system substrate-binding protein